MNIEDLFLKQWLFLREIKLILTPLEGRTLSDACLPHVTPNVVPFSSIFYTYRTWNQPTTASDILRTLSSDHRSLVRIKVRHTRRAAYHQKYSDRLQCWLTCNCQKWRVHQINGEISHKIQSRSGRSIFWIKRMLVSRNTSIGPHRRSPVSGRVVTWKTCCCCFCCSWFW